MQDKPRRSRPPNTTGNRRSRRDWPDCRHCRKQAGSRGRGLCHHCWSNPDVREQYPPANPHSLRREPTMEELERTIAEQMQCLPAWWEEESTRYDSTKGFSR